MIKRTDHRPDSYCVADLLLPRSKIDTPLSLLVARMDSTAKKSFGISVIYLTISL
jgi:hypothetical protein